eukprot:Tamp_07209.p8 GENE.Tamp_07209~~Tamp_07209.p8  ORF type:complete len:115 (-),score=11.23 Tamp_07209:1106-1450(-)
MHNCEGLRLVCMLLGASVRVRTCGCTVLGSCATSGRMPFQNRVRCHSVGGGEQPNPACPVDSSDGMRQACAVCCLRSNPVPTPRCFLCTGAGEEASRGGRRKRAPVKTNREARA